MDGQDVRYGYCSKCKGLKQWNAWYHHDVTLCDDCYYLGGAYYNLTPEEAQKLERFVQARLEEQQERMVKYSNTVEHMIGKFNHYADFRVFGHRKLYSLQQFSEKYGKYMVKTMCVHNGVVLVKLEGVK